MMVRRERSNAEAVGKSQPFVHVISCDARGSHFCKVDRRWALPFVRDSPGHFPNRDDGHDGKSCNAGNEGNRLRFSPVFTYRRK